MERKGGLEVNANPLGSRLENGYRRRGKGLLGRLTELLPEPQKIT
jgi:hypothetical protein